MSITKIPSKLNNFLKEVKLEIKKVNWPTQKETIRYTLIVVVTSIVVAIFLGGVDYLFTTFLDKLII